MSGHQKQLALGTMKRYREIANFAEFNASVMDAIALFGREHYGLSQLELSLTSVLSDYEVLELFNHLVRDWSTATEGSRELLFDPIKERLSVLDDRAHARILVPGSGAGGLSSELSRGTREVDCVELDPMMYLASKFATQTDETFSIYPWILEFSHWRHRNDQLEHAELKFSPSRANFYLQDFLTFDRGYKYDAVVTLFFMDTAENLLDYINKIGLVLLDDGIWINYGPLKWGSAPKLEPTADEIFEILSSLGWEVADIFEGSNRYTGSPKSMWDAKYKLVGWVARRKRDKSLD